jgi:hypothetical protein
VRFGKFHLFLLCYTIIIISIITSLKFARLQFENFYNLYSQIFIQFELVFFGYSSVYVYIPIELYFFVRCLRKPLLFRDIFTRIE